MMRFFRSNSSGEKLFFIAVLYFAVWFAAGYGLDWFREDVPSTFTSKLVYATIMTIAMLLVNHLQTIKTVFKKKQ